VSKKYGTRFVVWLKYVWKNEKKKIENLGLIIERLTVGIAWHSCCGETFCFISRPSYVIRISKEKKKRPSGVAHCVSTSLSIQENWRRHLKALFGDRAKISFVSAEWTGRMWNYRVLGCRYSDIVVCVARLFHFDYLRLLLKSLLKTNCVYFYSITVLNW